MMMEIFKNPPPEEWKSLARRPVFEPMELFPAVREVFENVRLRGDAALAEYTLKYDRVSLTDFKVKEEEFLAAEANLDSELKEAIQRAYDNIYKFHEPQLEKPTNITTTEGVVCRRENRPIGKVGLYIPGGSAPLFSTVLMLGVPARIAGCEEVVLCTPPDKAGNIHPAILYAAWLVGAARVLKLGGIQAIAALALGTKSVPKADKIFGPGNQYVTAAKLWAQNLGIAIDLPAGPSEVLVLADEYVNPAFAAADLLSQAEHGPDSQVILVCTDEYVAAAVREQVEIQLQNLPRKEIAAIALQKSKIIVVNSVEEGIRFSNTYAPEHLILAVSGYEKYVPLVKNAGSVFLGNYSCESFGDYASGTNHTLPTNGFARAYSGVSVDSFVKKITFQEISPRGVVNLGRTVEIMAEAEQLFGHKNAVTLRINELSEEKES